MKRKLIELDVDFIGGQDPMTKEEEKAISEFIKADKLKLAKKSDRKKRIASRNKLRVK